MMELGEYEFLKRFDDRLDLILSNQRAEATANRRIERLLIGIISLMADEDADKAKAKALLAQTVQHTEALKAALATFPALPPTQP